MKKKLDTRIEKLEQVQPGSTQLLVVYEDPDQPGEYTEKESWRDDPGKRYTQAELDALKGVEVLKVVYEKDWRRNREQG